MADDPASLNSQVDILRDLICRIGWMADLGADKIGGSQARGGAEAWLLSPLYNESQNSEGVSHNAVRSTLGGRV